MSLRHAFVVAAYGHSPHLEDCLRSLDAQQVRSPLVISTSTPFAGLHQLAARHGAALHVHADRGGIGADWNAALTATDCALVTIVHQDDVYLPEFAAAVIAAHARHPDVALSFGDAREIFADGRPRRGRLNQWVKSALVGAASLGSDRIDGALRRRLLLGFGNPILCAAVTFNRAVAPDFRFRRDLRTNMDWLAWIELARQHPLLRIRKHLLLRRVHAASETQHCIQDGAREREDRLVFEQLWPKPVARALMGLYRFSYPAYSK
ncbi:glycosyltransferase family A protein [Thermomonas flagellata]|uniref:glycosyltransferase family A protein n=1 Tax=Thermomonas flagellata TaxID=2888524 RepID=UPI001F04BF26|nr:glycosyltransferase family A protein [Thermomonas flagellata]